MTEEQIFHEALERPADQRAAFLAEACGEDTALRQRVEVLLAAHANPGSFLAAPPHAGEIGVTLDRPITEMPGTQIGPYKLLQQIGEGGMGTVFMAEQSTPVERRVALKVIKPGMDSRQVISRFEAERQALAIMDHPNIAKVFDAGTTDSGRPYFVMELVKGVPVTEYCDQQHLTPRERLELFVPICQAVQHAHQKGIIHRDLKPTNILIARYDDKAVPKIIDFGVAKAISQRLTEKTMFTQFGQIVGTIEYMSPEQAQFNQLDVDTRSDIYSLGVLLYELLTGETPFDKQRLRSAAFDELLRIIREEEPARPSTRLSSSQTLPSIAANRSTEPNKLSGLVRGELDWIVMKALDKDRTRRYETANAFARDVQRYLSDEQVEACPPSTAYRFRKFVRRNRASLATAFVVALALVSGSTIATWQAVRASREATRASNAEILAKNRYSSEKLAREQADEAVETLEWEAYKHNLALADREFQGCEIAAARQALERCPTKHRGWEWQYVSNLLHLDAWTFHSHSGEPLGVGLSPDGRHVAVASSDGYVRAWNTRSKEAVFAVKLSANAELDYVRGRSHGNQLDYSPDGHRIAVGCLDGSLALLDAGTGSVVTTLSAHSGPTIAVNYSPDGRKLVTGGHQNAQIKVWKTDDLQGEPLTIPGNPEGLISVVFSPDGAQVLSTHKTGCVSLWDAISGQQVRSYERSHEAIVYSGCFQPDGRQFVTGAWDGTLKVWDVERVSPRYTFNGHTGFVRSVAVSPDGRLVASTGEDKTVRLWNLATGRAINTLRGHEGFVLAGEFSNDGRILCTSSEDGTVKLWRISTAEGPLHTAHTGWYYPMVLFHPDGRRIAVPLVENVEIRDTTTSERLLNFQRPHDYKGVVRIIAFSPDGTRFAFATLTSGVVQIRDCDTGTELTRFVADSDQVNALCFTADGTQIVTGGTDGIVYITDVATGMEAYRMQVNAPIYALAVDQTDRRIACASMDGHLTIAETHTGTPRLVLRRSIPALDPLFDPSDHSWTFVDTLAFSPDGRRIAAAGGAASDKPGDTSVWDVQTGELQFELRGHSALVNAVAFSPDGTRIATGSNDGTIKLWSAEAGQEVFAIRHHLSGVVSLDYSPDGDRLLSSSIDRTFRIFDGTPQTAGAPN